jgi:hypothetical protein
LNPTKALKKGLMSITEDDIMNALNFVKDKENPNDEVDNLQQLKDKYPFYRRIMAMSVATVSEGEGNEIQMAYASGLVTTCRILIKIAENKN